MGIETHTKERKKGISHAELQAAVWKGERKVCPAPELLCSYSVSGRDQIPALQVFAPVTTLCSKDGYKNEMHLSTKSIDLLPQGTGDATDSVK